MDRIAAYIACFMLGFTLAFWMNNRNAHLIMRDQIMAKREASVSPGEKIIEDLLIESKMSEMRGLL